MSEVNDSFKKYFPLLMVGGGVDFSIYLLKSELKYLRFGFSVRRFFEFSNIMQTNIEYPINNSNTFLANQKYKGGHWMLNRHLIVAI